MKHQNGYALLEVLTSIVILGIVVTCITSITKTIQQVEKNMLFKKYALQQVDTLLQQFAIDPCAFYDNLQNGSLQAVYQEGRFWIYYDATCFNKTANPSSNYFILDYQRVDNIYTLSITIYRNQELYQLPCSFHRSVYWRTENEE